MLCNFDLRIFHCTKTASSLNSIWQDSLIGLKHKLMGGRKKPHRHWVKKYCVGGHYGPKESHITKFKGSGKLSGTGRVLM